MTISYRVPAEAVGTPTSRHDRAQVARSRASSRERVLVLGLTPLAERMIREVDGRGTSYVVIGVVDDWPAPARNRLNCPVVGPFLRLPEIVAELRPERVVIALAERRGRTPVRALLESCLPQGVVVQEAAEFYETVTGKLAIEALTPTSIAFSQRFRPSLVQQVFARGLSLSAAILFLVLFGPVLALIAVAIRLESRGSALLSEERIGLHGRPFRLYRFRTEDYAVAHPAASRDQHGERLTRVGEYLRTYCLEDLPQFINILKGDMNLVGPRPQSASDLQLFTLVSRNVNEITGHAIGYYALRSMVRPGLTGWAQVRCGRATTLDGQIEKLRFDLYYVKHTSPILDLRILWETLKLLVSGRLQTLHVH